MVALTLKGKEAALDMKTFAARLKQLREAAGLSQKTLAERAGLTQRAVSAWEQADREPGVLAVVALAKALAVGVEVLLAEPGSVPTPKRGRPRKPKK